MAVSLSSSTAQRGKRVAFLFAHLHAGGMQKAVSNISCALPASFEQFVVFFGSDNPGFSYRAQMVNLDVPGDLGTGPVRKAANFRRRQRLLQEFIDTNRIDTVVSFGEAASVLNSLTKRKRTVLSVRVSVEEGLANAGWVRHIYRRLVQILYRRADLVVPVSQALAEQMNRLYGVPAGKMRVIYNLYDIEKIRGLSLEPLPADMEPVFESPIVVNVGSLIHQKGQEHLIRAFAIARKTAPELRLVIVGRGELESDLRALTAALGLTGAIHFAGYDENPYRYLSRACMFVLTSRFEGFPNVLAEAMICGLPVIATDCKTGPREILGDSQHGFLLPDICEQNAEDVERGIAAAIVRLACADCARHYGDLAAARAADFSQDRLVGEWVDAL